MFEGPNKLITNSESIDPRLMATLTKKTTEVNGRNTTSLEPFIEIYGQAKVQEDYSKVAERLQGHLEHKWSDDEKLGHIFEAAFLDLAQQHHWFGERSEIIKASKFDDVMNGIDMIVTLLDTENTARHFEVATDLTTSRMGLTEKFNRLVGGVQKGHLATINYFHSELIGFTGRLRDVPRTVIALDKENTMQLLRYWVHEPELSQRQFAAILLEQIRSQARGLARFSAKHHGRGSIIHSKYHNLSQTAEHLLEGYADVAAPNDGALTTITSLAEKL